MADAAPIPYARDPYLEWAHAQGVPIVEDFCVDIRKVPVAPWARYGMNGALCHLKGRDDCLTVFAFELPPGGRSEALHHLYEEVIYVISGHGSTAVTLARSHTCTLSMRGSGAETVATWFSGIIAP